MQAIHCIRLSLSLSLSFSFSSSHHWSRECWKLFTQKNCNLLAIKTVTHLHFNSLKINLMNNNYQAPVQIHRSRRVFRHTTTHWLCDAVDRSESQTYKTTFWSVLYVAQPQLQLLAKEKEDDCPILSLPFSFWFHSLFKLHRWYSKTKDQLSSFIIGNIRFQYAFIHFYSIFWQKIPKTINFIQSFELNYIVRCSLFNHFTA